MPRKQVGAIDADLLAEVDKRAEWLGQTRRVFIERAAEQALSEAKEPPTRKQSDPGSVPSSEGVRSAAPAEPTRDQIYWRPDSPEERLLLGRNADSSQSKRDVRPRPKGGK